jgi:hypothetical protein
MVSYSPEIFEFSRFSAVLFKPEQIKSMDGTGFGHKQFLDSLFFKSTSYSYIKFK